MAYIGAEPSNNFVSLKRQVITGNGGSTYTLDHSVASVNDVAIFVNNVRQDPASYSISGTALTLGGTISSSDSCYVIFLGQALQTVTPATGTVTNAMLGETITVAKGGTGLTSGFANGITEADMYRLTADLTSNADPISANLERVDDASFSKIGTGVTVSSGIFSFAKTGIYFVLFQGCASGNGDNDNVFLDIKGTTDNSSYTEVARGFDRPAASGHGNCFCESLIDVTDTTTHKIQFRLHSLSTDNQLRGDTSMNETTFTFIRLGDT